MRHFLCKAVIVGALAATNHVQAGWTAYNDCAWHQDPTLFAPLPGTEDEANGYTTNSPWGLVSGPLTATNGAATGVNVAFSGVVPGMLARWMSPEPGSPADLTFTGKVGTNNAVTWSQGTLTMTLSGLNSAQAYSLVIWSTRGAATPSYSNRSTEITLLGADLFTNNSSAGLVQFTNTVANDSTRVPSASTGGRIARYDGIRAGADGTLVVNLTAAGSETNGYLNAFMLQEIDLAGPPSIQNTTASVDSQTAATLGGNLTSTGGAPTQVWVFWKAGSDGGTNKASWTFTAALGSRAAGNVSHTASGLQTNTLYYYRFLASNANGQAWGTPAQSFTTLAGASGVYPIVLGPAPRRQMFASSRKTGFIVSEILYHPRQGQDTDGEFIELYNTESWPEDLTGYRLTGAINYTFPSGTLAGARSYLVIAQNPAVISNRYGITSVLGPFTGSLNDDGGTIRLQDMANYPLLEARFDDGADWPLAADGPGHSLVLSRPDHGESDPLAWTASARIGGNPGSPDQPPTNYPLAAIVMNEFLAHTDPPYQDSIELYNAGTGTVDISGCYLTDNPDQPTRFRIPNGTTLAPRACRSFSDTNVNITLKLAGGRIYLINPEATIVLDSIAYEAQERHVSMGRCPNGSALWNQLAAMSLGSTNGPATNRGVVINEIMFNPITGNDSDEYIELHNRAATNISLANWRFNDGVDYTFPPGATISAGGYLVIASDAASLRTRYAGTLTTTNCYGNYDGTLANGGERIALVKPDDPTLPYQDFVVVDEVTYGDGWGTWADGGGSSLELIDPRSENRLSMNWTDSDESAKGVWTTIEKTGILDNCFTNGIDPAQFDSTYRLNRAIHVFMLGAGECLIDDVQVLKNGSAINVQYGDFSGSLGNWLTYGTHDTTVWSSSSGYGGSGAMRLLAQAAGNDGYNGTMGFLDSGLNMFDTNVTVRFKAKWVKGSRAVSGLLKGNGIEAWGLMEVAPNGTPGAQNSRYASNRAPAIQSPAHSPILPAANQAVTISAFIHDPDDVSAVELKYRIDPSYSTNTVSMNDTGTSGDRLAGDGIYSGQIPGQSSNTLAAFTIEAVDPQGNRSRNPVAVEGLVLFGQLPTPGDYASLRIWTHNTTITNWYENFRLSNKRFPITLIYNTDRAIYEAGSKVKGSPWSRSRPGMDFYGNLAASTITELEHGFQIRLPRGVSLNGSRVIDMDGLNYHERGITNNAAMDPLFMRERLYFWMVRQVGMPSMHQRPVHVYGNNFHKGIVYGDGTYPDAALCEEWYGSAGDFNSGTAGFAYRPDWTGDGNPDAGRDGWMWEHANETIEDRRSADGSLKEEIFHRWWERDGDQGESLDFSRLFAFVRMANMPLDNNYPKYFGMVAEPVKMMESIAGRHLPSNYDCWTGNGKSCGLFFPERGLAMTSWWDIDYGMGAGGSETNSVMPVDWGVSASSYNWDNTMNARAFKSPGLMRPYWRKHQEFVDGPLRSDRVNVMIDRYYQGHLTNGLTAFIKPRSQDAQILLQSEVDVLKQWVAGRRAYLADRIRSYTNCAFSVATGSYSTSSKRATVTGLAPVRVASLRVNGQDHQVLWTGMTNWQLDVAMTANGGNLLTITAHDTAGNQIGSGALTVTYTGSVGAPTGLLVINEIMYNPATPGASYVEVFNRSTAEGYDLGGFKLGGLDFSFSPGTWLGPTSYCIVAGDLPSYANAHTGAVLQVVGKFNGTLDNGGETITLEQPTGTSQYQTTNQYGQPVTVTVTNYTLIDTVTYDDDPPWPVEADGSGASLQVIDPAQDNSRVGNWDTGGNGWQYVTATGTAGSATLYLYVLQSGSVYLDDISFVAGTTPELGQNCVSNGNFESTLAGPWSLDANMTASVITGNARSGNGCLLLSASSPGSSAACIRQGMLNVTNGLTYTLSYWYRPATTTNTLVIRISGSGVASTAPVQIGTDLYTPGRSNSVGRSLQPLASLWINEIMPSNATSSITDNMGQREPWLELFNGGGSSIDLAVGQYYLSDNLGILTQWAFPAGSSISANGLLRIWLDGQTNQTAGGHLHTSFRVNSQSGIVALVRMDNGAVIVDSISYQSIPADHSYGGVPNGSNVTDQIFDYPSPGTTNTVGSSLVAVRINEWMANNGSGGVLADPADGDFDDWFELYNADVVTADLSGYILTDGLSLTNGYVIPGGWSLAPGTHMLVWADDEADQNGPGLALHVNFKLDQTLGESIRLFAPDGTLVDAVTFGPQIQNVSELRYPDGQSTFLESHIPTPGTTNRLLMAAVMTQPTGGVVNLTWNTLPGQRYELVSMTNLATMTWASYSAETNAISATMTFTLPHDGRIRFYRLIQK